jgi:hypothetical protein
MENTETAEEKQLMDRLLQSLLNHEASTHLGGNTQSISRTEQMMNMAKAYKKPKPVIVERKKRSMFDGYEEVIRYLRSGKKFSWKEVHSFFLDSGVRCSYQTLMKFATEKKIGSHPKSKKRNKKFIIVN